MLKDLKFTKIVAAGNDFVLLNNVRGDLSLNADEIRTLCHRRFGIGADGVILLGDCEDADFRMHYFNADGTRGEMCGNGARSLVLFADGLKMAQPEGVFRADDGHHGYRYINDKIEVEIKVADELHPVDVPQPESGYINTVVPHLVVEMEDIQDVDLDKLGWEMMKHPALYVLQIFPL